MMRNARLYDARRRALALAGVFVAALLLGTSGVRAHSETFTGDVVGVIDGDTLGVLVTTPRRQEVRVRLWGIDAPEKVQPYGARAKQALSALVWGKRVQVDVRDTDRYGRMVAVVTVAGRDINAAMVADGFAWWYSRYASRAYNLQAAEAAARHDRRGLWADPAPVPPWEWRQGRTTAFTLRSMGTQDAVYVTRTGGSYHRAGCAYASRATGTVRRTEATSRGLTPCRVCRP